MPNIIAKLRPTCGPSALLGGSQPNAGRGAAIAASFCRAAASRSAALASSSLSSDDSTPPMSGSV